MIILSACDSGTPPTSDPTGAAQPSDAWSAVRFNSADEVEGYATLEEMGVKADAVALGHFTSFATPRVFQGAAAEDVIAYAPGEFVVDDLLQGALPKSDSVVVEFMLNGIKDEDSDDSTPIAVVPLEEPMVIFLRDKGGSESGLYRAVNSRGLWSASVRAPLDAPLAESTPAEGGYFASELEGVSSVAELADLLRS